MWIYKITFEDGRVGHTPSQERIYDCLRFFRERFGADRIMKITEQFGDGEPVPSELLPTCREEAEAINARREDDDL